MSCLLACLFDGMLLTLVLFPHQARGVPLPMEHIVGLTLSDVVVDSPPVLPVLFKETGDLEDVRHCLRIEDQPGMSSDKVFTGFILTVPF